MGAPTTYAAPLQTTTSMIAMPSYPVTTTVPSTTTTTTPAAKPATPAKKRRPRRLPRQPRRRQRRAAAATEQRYLRPGISEMTQSEGVLADAFLQHHCFLIDV